MVDKTLHRKEKGELYEPDSTPGVISGPPKGKKF
jgi:hypothetical protein